MAHICQYLSAVAGKSPEQLLTVCGERCKTAQLFKDRVAALAAALTDTLAIQPGDVVLLALESTDCFLESLLAVAAAGAISAPLNLRWSSTEAAAAVKLCKAKVVLLEPASLHLKDLIGSTSCACLQHAVIVNSKETTIAADSMYNSEQLILHHWGSQLLIKHSSDGAAIICFTSGTTGQPKGALISHTALHCQAMAKVLMVGYNASDIYLHAAPVFHIGGLSSAIAVLMVGGTHVFMGRFNAANSLDIIARKHITSFIAVPAMMADLTAAATGAKAGAAAASTGQAGNPDPRQYASVQRVLMGAGGMSSEQVSKIQAVFPMATVHSAYGMTEACSSMTFKLLLRREQSDHHLHTAVSRLPVEPPADSGVSVGMPPPGIEMAVLTSHAATGCRCKQPNEAILSSLVPINVTLDDDKVEASSVGKGELLTRGPHVLMRYWDQPAESSQVMLPGGWLRTGDVGRIDANGSVWLKGRVQDIVRSGGESVHAVEVEQILTQHPAVQAAAVFGIPHQRLGEQVAAVLSLDKTCMWSGPMLTTSDHKIVSEHTLTPASMQAFCRQANLSSYKLPRIIVAHHEPLPLNASGKVMKLELKHALLDVLHVQADHGVSLHSAYSSAQMRRLTSKL